MRRRCFIFAEELTKFGIVIDTTAYLFYFSITIKTVKSFTRSLVIGYIKKVGCNKNSLISCLYNFFIYHIRIERTHSHTSCVPNIISYLGQFCNSYLYCFQSTLFYAKIKCPKNNIKFGTKLIRLFFDAY